MTIHSDHPFASPDDVVRRLRGRLGGAVTLLTSGLEESRAGLTISSLMIANGDPGRLLALLDPEATVTEQVATTGRAVCHWLSGRHRDLAEAFAGQLPAPGGLFRLAAFSESAFGPRLEDVTTYADLELESQQEVGWSALLTFRIAGAVVGTDDDALEHRRGRYHALGSGS